MSDKRQNIDEVFRRGLEGYSKNPPPEAWAGISGYLDRRRKRAFLMNLARIAATVTILLGFGGGLIQLLRDDKGDNHLGFERLETSGWPEITDISPPYRTTPSTSPADVQAAWTDDPGYNAVGFRESELSYTRGVIELKEDIVKKSEYDYSFLESLPPAVKTEKTGDLQLAAGKEMPMAVYVPPHIPQPERRWSAGLMAAPAYSFRSLSQGENGTFNKAYFNSFESGIFTATGRVTVSYSITGRLAIQTGLDLIRVGQQIDNTVIISDPNVMSEVAYRTSGNDFSGSEAVSNSIGKISRNTTRFIASNKLGYGLDNYQGNIPASTWLIAAEGRGKLIQGLHYLQMPVILRYKLLDGPTAIVASGGLGASFLSGNRVMLHYEGETLDFGKTLNIKPFGLTGIVSLGMERQLQNGFILHLEPRLSHFITPVNNGPGPNVYPWSFSFYGGAAWRF